MSDTAVRIIDTAEELFAAQGFTETSIRQITTEASVNLAAINYHFGAKNNLIQAVFERYLSFFFKSYKQQLDQLGRSPEQREALLIMINIIVGPEADLIKAQRFMRLLRYAFAQRQGHIRKYIRDTYGADSRMIYQHLVGPNRQGTSELEFFWQMQFLLGASIFSLAEFSTLNELSVVDYGEQLPAKRVIELFIEAASRFLNLDS